VIHDTSHSVRDAAGRRWPVLDGIPFLRAGRLDLAAEALACLDAGDPEHALVLLLADQDDWWRGGVADTVALHELVRQRDRLTLRQAMSLLGWGPVADYFAHRWSDPVFAAGLALTEAHWTSPATAFELACGIGHHLRELALRGVAVTGADVVFAKLWVARHWLLPKGNPASEPRLFCFDAGGDWPLGGARFDLITCHDAFYFLEPKADIVGRLRAALDPVRGVLLVGHIHNAEFPNLSAGSAVAAASLSALFPAAALYDDAELTRALIEARAPVPAAIETLQAVEAFAVAEGPGLAPPRPVTGGLAVPLPGARLRRNPLYDAAGEVAWPSARYGREYGAQATYPRTSAAPAQATLDATTIDGARRREFVDLPERW